MKRISPRILTALIGIPLVLGVVSLGGIPFKILVSLLAFGALRELQTGITRSEGYGGARLVGAVAYVCVIWAIWNGISRGWALATLLALLLLCVMFYDSRARISLASLSLSVFCTLYVGLFALLPPLLQFQNGKWFWLMLFAVWGSDTLAYYAGRALGKHKMSTLSPGKTWEGFGGGFIGAVLVSALAGLWWKVPVADALTLGALVGFAAPLGDLAESFLKRELGLKDLGNLFPGHGGILDRCDSILFAGLVTSIWLRLL